jgi:hypothetical protein
MYAHADKTWFIDLCTKEDEHVRAPLASCSGIARSIKNTQGKLIRVHT